MMTYLIPIGAAALLALLFLIMRRRPVLGRSQEPPTSNDSPPEEAVLRRQYAVERRMQLKTIAKVNGWTRDAYHHVLRGQIAPGMNQDMVLLAWGGPSMVDHRSVTSGGTPVERWVYTSVTDDSVQAVWFADGRVARIEA
jgi:hypothetical protein